MRRDVLERMSEKEVDEYGETLGIELAPCVSLEEKVDMICRRRDRSVGVTLLGVEFEIPIKRVRDKRISDLILKPDASDEETYQAMELLLGENQMKRLLYLCTDDDGTVDADALGLAFVKLLYSEELKNF